MTDPRPASIQRPPGRSRRSRWATVRTTVAAVTVVAVGAGACGFDAPSAVVGVIVDSCDPGQDRGSGMVVAPGLVLTSAHVVAGAQGIQVVRDDRTAPAVIVAFDPQMDLAYLSTDLPGRPIPLSTSRTDSGDRGVAYVVRDGRVVALDVAIRRRVNIRTQDVYLEGSTLRPGFDLDGSVRTGDSGGAVVVDGRVIGVIWARSTRDETRAYAIDPVAGGMLVRSQLRRGSLGDDVDVARCH